MMYTMTIFASLLGSALGFGTIPASPVGVLGAKCGAHDYCTIRGVQCPSEHQDADMGATYAAIDGDDRWHYKGTLKDGRPWFESDSG